jgi:hypothetical protein
MKIHKRMIGIGSLAFITSFSFCQENKVMKNLVGADNTSTFYYYRNVTDYLLIGIKDNNALYLQTRGGGVGRGGNLDLLSLRILNGFFKIFNEMEINAFITPELYLDDEYNRGDEVHLIRPEPLGWNVIEGKLGLKYDLKINDHVVFCPKIQYLRGSADLKGLEWYADLRPLIIVEINIHY